MGAINRSDRSSRTTGGTREWLDNGGNFLFGKHEGENVEDLAKSAPGYLRWVLEEVENIADEDRDIIQGALDFAGRARRNR